MGCVAFALTQPAPSKKWHLASLAGFSIAVLLVLEYIDSRTLRAAMKEPGRDGVTFAIESMLSVTQALVRAHEMGIVHRDLKPENILLSKDGQIKVLDFGIAKQVSEALPEVIPFDSASLETKPPEQTQAGALVGALGSMSPEQIKGEPIDARTDIWPVGIILYELVTGERPVKGDSFTQIAGRACVHRRARSECSGVAADGHVSRGGS